MEKKWQKELCAAAVLTFEEMCLLMPDEISDGDLSVINPMSARVLFKGPMSGELIVSVDEGFLPELVGHIVGETECVDKELLLDGLGEVANIIAGNVLPRIGGAEAVFALDAPQSVPFSRVGNSCNALLVFEGNDVSVRMCIDS